MVLQYIPFFLLFNHVVYPFFALILLHILLLFFICILAIDIQYSVVVPKYV